VDYYAFIKSPWIEFIGEPSDGKEGRKRGFGKHHSDVRGFATITLHTHV
jgi:hypothetical protein